MKTTKKKAAAKATRARAMRRVELLVEVNQRLTRLDKRLAGVLALRDRVTDLEALYHDQGVRLEQLAERFGLDDASKP